jgi:HEAT repeats
MNAGYSFAVATFWALTGTSVLADDLPFGADALRHLAKEAQVVVHITQPHRLSIAKVEPNTLYGVNYSLYEVKVVDALRGSVAPGQELQIAFPLSVDVASVDDLSNAIVFLTKPSADLRKSSNLPPDQNVYLVVSGRYGAVAAQSTVRKQAIERYLGAQSNAQVPLADAAVGQGVLGWTQQYVGSDDKFLQRSAVIDLYAERGRPEAVRQLHDALKSDVVSASVKQTAIAALESIGTVSVLSPLKDAAENKQWDIAVRKAAVKATGNLPGGDAQLKRWIVANDPVLAPAARSTIEAVAKRKAIDATRIQ